MISYFVRRIIGGFVEHGSENRTSIFWNSARTDNGLLPIWRLVSLHISHSRDDGRTVSVPTYITSTLG